MFAINTPELEVIKKQLATLDSKVADYFSNFDDEPPTIAVFKEAQSSFVHGEYHYERSFAHYEGPVFFRKEFADYLTGGYSFSFTEINNQITVQAAFKYTDTSSSSKVVTITFI